MRVADVMSREVVTVATDTPAPEAVALLTGHGFAALPVLDAGGKLVGIVAEADLLAAAVPAAGQPVRDRPTRAADRTVGALMRTPVRCLSSTTHVSAAAEELVREHLRSMPVVDGGTVVGMVSRADLISKAL
jgi:CBS-domain-containing membrane protein